MKALRRWISHDTGSEDDTTDSDEGDWGTIERTKKNKLKKKKMDKKKKLKELKTLQKVRHMMGIGPIKNNDLKNEGEKNFEDVKIRTVKKLLMKELRFNEYELDNMMIEETMISSKGDGSLYCAFADLMDIREIHLRIAESKNDVLQTRDYIPPQLFNCYKELGRICTELRSTDPVLKTQVRFGDHDLEIFIKTRGSMEPYMKKDLIKVTDVSKLPTFDHRKVWKFKIDRPRRWQVDYTERRGNKYPMSRQSSIQDGNKKSRTDRMEEGSDSPSTTDDDDDDEVETPTGEKNRSHDQSDERDYSI